MLGKLFGVVVVERIGSIWDCGFGKALILIYPFMNSYSFIH